MQRTRFHSKRSFGFTIVEVAVIIVVIGILASIITFSISLWRTRVAESEVKSDLNGVRAAMDSKRNFGNGYPVTPEFDGANAIFQQSPGVVITYYSGDSKGFCVNAKSKVVPGVSYHYRSSSSLPEEGTCSGEVDISPSVPNEIEIATNYRPLALRVEKTTGVVYFATDSGLYRTTPPSSTVERLVTLTTNFSGNAIAIDSVGGYVYVFEGGSSVVKVDIASKTKTVLFTGIEGGETYSMDLRDGYLYVGARINNKRGVHRIDTSSGAMTTLVSTGFSYYTPFGIAIDAMGRYIYVAAGGSSSGLWRVDLTSSSPSLDLIATIPDSGGLRDMILKGGDLYVLGRTSIHQYNLASGVWSIKQSQVKPEQTNSAATCIYPAGFDISGGRLYYFGLPSAEYTVDNCVFDANLMMLPV